MSAMHSKEVGLQNAHASTGAQDAPGGDGAQVEATLDTMRRREQALADLLRATGSGDGLVRAAVEAIVTAYTPRIAGIALFRSERTSLSVEHLWVDRGFAAPCIWDIRQELLDDILVSGDTAFQCHLPSSALPSDDAARWDCDASLCCELLRFGESVRGFLFWANPGDESASPAPARDIGHLVALRISSELKLEEERCAGRKKEQFFEDIASIAYDFFWELDADFRFTHLSDRWREITGIDAEAYYGKDAFDLGIDASKERWKIYHSTLEAHEPIRGLGTRTVCPDGREIFWKINGTPFYGEDGEFLGYRGTGTDVTTEVVERRRAEKAERLLHEAIEAIPQGVVLFDENDRLVVSNKSYKDIYSEIATELVPGASFGVLVDIWSKLTIDRPDGVSPLEMYKRRMKAHTYKSREFEYVRGDGRAFLINEQKMDDGSTVCLHTDITALKQREEDLEKVSRALAAKNDQMDRTINNMGEAVVMYDAEGNIVLFNETYRAMFGFKPDQLYEGAPSEVIRKHLYENGMLGEENDDLNEVWSRIREQGKLTFRRQWRDGRVLEGQGARLADGGIVLTGRDVTDTERQQKALRDGAQQLEMLNAALEQKNAYFDATLNSMMQGLATFDPEDRLVFWNKRFLEIFSLPDELVREGASVEPIVHHILENRIWDDAAATVPNAHRETRENGSSELTIRLNNNRSFDVICRLVGNGDILITFSEVTAFEENAARLRDYAEKLEFSNKELQEFAYVASHDLQEPLRKIEAFSDRLLSRYSDRLDENGQVYLERMQNASTRMRTLIRDLLDYSRISTKAKPFEEVDLGGVVDDVVCDLEIAIEASGGTVRHSGLPRITADAGQMRQIFQNLISNALKFRREGVTPEIEITASRKPAAARGDGSVDMVEIAVCDNGIGFDEKYADQIFKIFQRLHGRSEYEGTGIGLATCRKIMDRHRGSISASSQPGEKTTFRILLPVEQPVFEEECDASG